MGFLIMLLPWLELLTLVELGILTSALTVLVYVFVTVVVGMAILIAASGSRHVRAP